MSILYLSYIDLNPELENRFADLTHHAVIGILRKNFHSWQGFFDKYPKHSIGFIVTTKKEIVTLEVKGPTVYKKKKIVDFAIFLPDVSLTLEDYIDFVFKGVSISLGRYGVKKSEVLTMSEECKKILAIMD